MSPVRRHRQAAWTFSCTPARHSSTKFGLKEDVVVFMSLCCFFVLVCWVCPFSGGVVSTILDAGIIHCLNISFCINTFGDVQFQDPFEEPVVHSVICPSCLPFAICLWCLGSFAVLCWVFPFSVGVVSTILETGVIHCLNICVWHFQLWGCAISGTLLRPRGAFCHMPLLLSICHLPLESFFFSMKRHSL